MENKWVSTGLSSEELSKEWVALTGMEKMVVLRKPLHTGLVFVLPGLCSLNHLMAAHLR